VGNFWHCIKGNVLIYVDHLVNFVSEVEMGKFQTLHNETLRDLSRSPSTVLLTKFK
jgi:hypothetical protein